MRRRGLLVGLLVAVQVCVLAFATLAAAARWVSLPVDGDMYVLLVMGSDQGPPRSGSVVEGRADAIQLVVIDEQRTHVSILSIPRDSYVPVRGLGTTKINAMLTRGPENAVATVEDLTGLQIDDWIVTGFDGFVRAIDDFGPVPVNVERRLLDPSGAHTDLQPGVQPLTGTQSLAFSRDRHSRPNGDFGRTAAQAGMLQAMQRALTRRADSPAGLLAAAATLRRNTVSSISTDRLIRLGVLATRIRPDHITQVTAPGRVGRAGRASVVYLSDSVAGIYADLRDDGRLDATG